MKTLVITLLLMGCSAAPPPRVEAPVVPVDASPDAGPLVDGTCADKLDNAGQRLDELAKLVLAMPPPVSRVEWMLKGAAAVAVVVLAYVAADEAGIVGGGE